MAAGSAERAAAPESRCDARGCENGDGWGMAWYPQASAPMGGPLLLRSPRPAHDDPVYKAGARRAVGEIVVAHVRKASVGATRVVNCHPFVMGGWVFAHNGGIPGFDRLEGHLLADLSPPYREARLGQTDSECLFLWLLQGWERAAGGAGDEGDLWAAYLAEAFGELEGPLLAQRGREGQTHLCGQRWPGAAGGPLE